MFLTYFNSAKIDIFQHVFTAATMATTIRDFWKANPQYWFANEKTRDEADEVIYTQFHETNFILEDMLGIILYLDQFMRHFSRIVDIPEPLIRSSREYAALLVSGIPNHIMNSLNADELVWYVMPWKHLKTWTPLFQTISSWLLHSGRPITDFPLLNRFFMDTYKKAYTPEVVSDTLQFASRVPTAPFIAADICESYPAAYVEDDWFAIRIPACAKPLLDAFSSLKEPMILSLSGGVDSMLMLALLCRIGYDITAIHIVYGNRPESAAEQQFIMEYCAQLSIPLYIYTVEWLRRGAVTRDFYEEMTRRLRFSAYRALHRPVLLGHIHDDMIENVWTNFARGTHVDDLAKFRAVSQEDGVTIYRPWLSIEKSLIYEVAGALAIPYLKNTTPSWSNRGKFRNAFYNATHAQFGASVDSTVLTVASRLHTQSALVKRILFDPIYESWNALTRSINITRALGIDLDADGWQHILTDLAHKRLGIRKPSFTACVDFAVRISKNGIHNRTFVLHKDLKLKAIQQDKLTLLIVL